MHDIRIWGIDAEDGDEVRSDVGPCTFRQGYMWKVPLIRVYFLGTRLTLCLSFDYGLMVFYRKAGLRQEHVWTQTSAW